VAYDPILPDIIHQGIDGTDAVLGRLRDNHNAAWEDYEAPLFSAGGGETSLELVSASTATGSLSISYATFLRWVCPRNLDGVPVSIEVLWVASADATLRITSGANSATASITPGGASIVHSTLSVVPAAAAGASPLLAREMILEMQADTGGVTTVEVIAVIARYSPGSLPSGVQSSAWTRMAALADDADEPLTSERAHRMLEGPALIIADRPPCLASMAQDVVNALAGTGDYGNIGITWQSGYRWNLPDLAASDRYGIAVYVQGTGPWEVVVATDGGKTTEFSGSSSGWQFATIVGTPGPIGGTVRIRWLVAAGGFPVTIHTVQLFRLDSGA